MSTDARGKPSFVLVSTGDASILDCAVHIEGVRLREKRKSLTGVPDGVHAYTAKATDAGGTSPASNTRTITVDTTPPDTIVDSGPSGTTSASYAIFSFHSPDGTATLECRLDGPGSTTGLWGACASPKTYRGLASGAYTFSARATDPAGNTDPIPATDTWTVGSSS